VAGVLLGVSAEAKVGHFDVVLEREQQIAHGEIAVHHVVPVQVLDTPPRRRRPT
jgi:hypothetical protein